ncbi:MAG: hypothetical protein ACFFC7_30745 [Candidatus Hermodarchaeota archaeon]
MEITPKKIMLPTIIGLLVWIVAFFLIGWTVISEDPAIQALYLPMVVLFAIGNFLLLLILFYWYFPHLSVDIQNEWFSESLLFGVILMALQFILDIIAFSFIFPTDLVVYFFGRFLGNSEGSTVIVSYPLIVIWSVLAGYIVMRLRK